MRLVRAEFHLGLDGLWVASSSLGGSATFVRDGFTVQIDLPADRAAFALLPRDKFPRGAFGGHSSGTGATSVQEVDIIRVSVSGPLDLRAAAFGAPGSVPNRDAMDHVRIFARTTLDIARSTVIELADRLRTEKGQVWIGFGTALPEVVGLTSYFDEDGDRLPVGFGDSTVVYPLDPSLALDSDYLIRLPSVLGDGRADISAEDRLLADARQLVPTRPSDIGFARPLIQQAILVAAVAVEVKTKATLRRVTPADKADLIDLILDNPRDVSVAAVNLLHKTMDASIGRSLQRDDAGLFKAAERLFKVRNGIAHRGEEPAVQEARELLDAAVRVFDWLNGL
jgi:hypothetical protein